jgi:hypothetical protein
MTLIFTELYAGRDWFDSLPMIEYRMHILTTNSSTFQCPKYCKNKNLKKLNIFNVCSRTYNYTLT